ncbi:hypothetical protein ACFL2B_02235 [Patescibacteria group bacterium]
MIAENRQKRNKRYLPLILVVCFLVVLCVGVGYKEIIAAGAGSEDGLGDPGSSLYSASVLWETRQLGLLGYYEDTLGGIQFADGSALAHVWLYNGVPGGADQDLDDGDQCAIGFGIDEATSDLTYRKACYKPDLGWHRYEDAQDGIFEIRIINVITDNLHDLNSVVAD